MNIYVIRHGQTNGNLNNLIIGEKDIDLNSVGIKQAYIAQEKIAKINYDLVICSPMKRTRHTCKIVNKIKNKQVIYDDRIIERRCGSLNGIKKNEFHYSDFWRYDKNVQYPGAEDIQTLYKRVWDFLDDITKNYSDKNILIVTHNGVCRAIRSYFNGIPKDGKLERIGHKNCQIRKYVVNKK